MYGTFRVNGSVHQLAIGCRYDRHACLNIHFTRVFSRKIIAKLYSDPANIWTCILFVPHILKIIFKNLVFGKDCGRKNFEVNGVLLTG